MADESSESGRIKVVDKRMFTADGELREDFQHLDEAAAGAPETPREASAPPSPAPSMPATEPGPAAPGEAAPADPAGALGKPGFMDLVGMLAEPVALYLGEVRLPDGGSAENLDAARFHIDLLEVVRSKTAGNLTAQESSVLEDLLYELRMRYVRKRG